MQGAKSLGRKQITSCHWNIPTFEYRVNKEEGVYVLLEGELTVQDIDSTFCLAPGELLFVRRGSYVVSTKGKDSRILWIPLSAQFLQGFVQRFGALLSEVERCDEPVPGIIAFAATPLLAGCVKGLKELLVHEHPPMLACLKIEELLMLFAFSPQGPLLMSVLRQLSNRHVERLQLFMEKHYLNEWKLSDFSREFGMGLTTFKEAVRQCLRGFAARLDQRAENPLCPSVAAQQRHEHRRHRHGGGLFQPVLFHPELSPPFRLHTEPLAAGEGRMPG